MFLKGLHKWFTSIALLAVIISFSGFTDYQSYPPKQQTEIVFSNTSLNPTTTKSFKFLKKHSTQNISFNQYTTFNFKSLLQVHVFNFNITFKTQKTTQLEFNNLSVLEQNLIAQIFSDDYQSNFIK
mgnify:CR=1 FL=1